MKKIISALLLCGMLSLASCTQNETPPSSAEETAVTTEAATETPTEAETEEVTEEITEEITEEVTEPEYFSQLVCPDTMTDKERSETYYRKLTLFDADKAYEIGPYHTMFLVSPSPESAKLKKYRDNIREMRMYDEQLDTNFLVHIILPDGYDENKEYPIFLMTDASSWISKLPNTLKLIREGEASPSIFVTVFNDYDTAGDFEAERSQKFIAYQDRFLDYITNDLMELISLNYKADASHSVIFGHSWGGIFTHYALCNSDRYEYQPFKNYIIGSSCFSMIGSREYWDFAIPEDYDDDVIERCSACARDFDYFDRNETMDKNVFICAGGDESGIESWQNGMSVVDNVTAFYDRLTSHGVNAELKIYEGMGHVSYVEDMLKEYYKQHFPLDNITENEISGGTGNE